MEQTKALNALEPFLALTKSATSPRAAADLIVRATSAPNTFIFTELLQTPQIQALASPSATESSSAGGYGPFLTILQIFSYGTYATYAAAQENLPALNPAQTLKLRQLSLLTLARDVKTDPSSALSYATLQSKLGLLSSSSSPAPRELEELVISAVYAGLLDAQLDPKHATVRINSVAALRDVAPPSSASASEEEADGAIGGLLTSLRAWADRCDATLQSLEAQMTSLRADADRRAAETAAWSDKVDALVADEKNGANKNKPSAANHNNSSSSGISTALSSSASAAGDIFSSGGMLTGDAGSFSGSGGGGGFGSTIANLMRPRFGGGGGGGASGSGSGGVSGGSIKRGSGQMEAAGDDDLSNDDNNGSSFSFGAGADAEDEAMDVDDEDESADGKKRANKRKL
ncbi:hypothetical protein B0T17DRAFT_536462 [Bombardia bombarda]|uniref:PCI domain-containing protein n=1 Tax=Bombardia bombarda TaxID=252184 RepID=A0AA39WM70_9PEZI|nr:hypothetical protein B0T17DRAFT_536462 [Bombardia bombarda]